MRLGIAIFVCLTGFYLAVGGRQTPWGDSRIMYEVAEGIVERRSVNVTSEWPPMSHRGPDGKIYSQYAAGPSLVSVPGVYLRSFVTDKGRSTNKFWIVVTSHLAPAMLGALTCVLFFGLCRRLGASPVAATCGTLTLAFATMVFVYARVNYSEILQTACVLGFATAVIAAADEPSRRRALVLGAWAALVLNAKAVLLLAVAGGGLHLLLALRRDRPALLRVIGWSMLGFLPGIVLFLAYNHARWGDPLDTGYGETLTLLNPNPFDGLWGLLLSPGKSVFLFSPPLVLGLAFTVRFARAFPGPARALALVGLPPLLFYSFMLSWSGDWCWGPRYITYLVPLLLVPAVVSGWSWVTRSRITTALASLVIVAGLGVQVLGVAFHWDVWFRIALHARLEWLGDPDRRGAATPVNKFGLCDACFEDVSGQHWLPPFSAITGHAWMLRHRGEPWATAQKSAPWRQYTKLELTRSEQHYKQVRLDWWGFVWLDELPYMREEGIVLLVVFLTLGLGGGVFWWRRVRAAAL